MSPGCCDRKVLTCAQSKIPVHHSAPASGDTHIGMFVSIHFITAYVGIADSALKF